MSTLFSRRAAGVASIAGGGLILLSQPSQIILVLTVPEAFFNATQSLRFGLAVAFLVMVEGRPAHRAGRTIEAQHLLARAAGFARVAAHPSQTAYVLTVFGRR